MNILPTGTHDVVIAGAGPVGLLLACELRLGGCSALVLEQQDDPRSPLKHAPFGLRGLSAATVGALDRRGLLDALLAATNVDAIADAAPWATAPRRPGGHFAGIDFFLDQVDRARWPYRLADAPGPMASDLASIETVLTARAIELGVSIRRGSGVSAVDADDEGVTLHAGAEAFRGGWLVGCDGGRSVVRKAAGFRLAGTDAEFTGYFGQITLADPDMLVPGHHATAGGTYIYERSGMVRMIEYDGGAHHRAAPITRDHVQAVLRRLSGRDVELTGLELATTWTDRAQVATTYRRGRVLLAGDAAHVHSPLGGQGLNLGLGDAMNLGWKLAATVRGDAAPGLLDGYERERRPVAERILDWSRAQAALMRPDPGSRALAAVVGDLIATRDGATHVAERVWGVGRRYDLAGDHPLVGHDAPNLHLADGTRLNEHCRDGRAVMLDLVGNEQLRALAERHPRHVAYLASAAGPSLGLSAVLIRPDGVVAWASERPADADGADRVIAGWFADAA